VTAELAFERSGPDRFMSTFPLLCETFDAVGESPTDTQAAELGRIVANLATLRRMSSSIAGMLQAGLDPATEAALVKDLGTGLEQEIPEVARRVMPSATRAGLSNDRYTALLHESQMQCVSYSIRGGTREILRGMIARGLGLR
jgi:hypothetical protein